MNWYDFILKHWAQVFAIGALIVGAFKIWLDYRNRRLEIKHSLFFREKIGYILKFHDAYFQVEAILRDYIARAEREIQLTANLDKDIFSNQQDLRSSLHHLRLLLDEYELQPFEAIVTNINRAGLFLLDFNFRDRTKDNIFEETIKNPIYEIQSRYIDVNKPHLNVIAQNTKRFYQMKN